jgi:hypothetical protein
MVTPDGIVVTLAWDECFFPFWNDIRRRKDKPLIVVMQSGQLMQRLVDNTAKQQDSPS